MKASPLIEEVEAAFERFTKAGSNYSVGDLQREVLEALKASPTASGVAARIYSLTEEGKKALKEGTASGSEASQP